MVWWLWEARGWDPETWLDPLQPFSVGTVLAQWTVAIVALLLLNRWLVRHSGTADGSTEERMR